MPQEPSYPEMVIAPHRVISTCLKGRYGDDVGWPLLWYDATRTPVDYRAIYFTTFEVNANNDLNRNLGSTSRLVQSFANAPASYKVDYNAEIREIEELRHSGVIPDDFRASIQASYANSYDFINSRDNNRYSTVDVDYLWRTVDNRNRGLEISTFFMPMFNRQEAERLFGHFLRRRASVEGAHQFQLQAAACENIFDSQLTMAFVNTVGHTNDILATGNALWFTLDMATADGLRAGRSPELEFGSLDQLLQSL